MPADVSVAGIGGVELLSPPEKPQSTVAFESGRVGRLGAELLLRRIEAAAGAAPEPVQHTVVPSRLVIGATTAPPRMVSQTPR